MMRGDEYGGGVVVIKSQRLVLLYAACLLSPFHPAPRSDLTRDAAAPPLGLVPFPAPRTSYNTFTLICRWSDDSASGTPLPAGTQRS